MLAFRDANAGGSSTIGLAGARQGQQQSLEQDRDAGGRVVWLSGRAGLGGNALGEMELVFARLARAACLWRWASRSLPHTRGTEYVYGF